MKHNFSLLSPGYYYDLDESYDESDEEEVKAHLRRVTEQPPLKLDTSSEVHEHHTLHTHIRGLKMSVICDIHLPKCLSPKKVDFLRVCGLTTLAHRDELLARKRRKRRRMMRERSLSPPAVRGKRKASSPSTPTAPLTTQYSAEQMDSTPELDEKKDFLLMFNLSHVSPQQRRGNNPTCYSALFTVVLVIPCGKILHSVLLFTKAVGGVRRKYSQEASREEVVAGFSTFCSEGRYESTVCQKCMKLFFKL